MEYDDHEHTGDLNGDLKQRFRDHGISPPPVSEEEKFNWMAEQIFFIHKDMADVKKHVREHIDNSDRKIDAWTKTGEIITTITIAFGGLAAGIFYLSKLIK